MQRRQFLAATSHTLLLTGVAPLALGAATSFAHAPQCVDGCRARYEALLNERLLLQTPAGATVPVQLVQITDRTHAASVEQFSLVFRAPGDLPLKADTYGLWHAKTGRFQLYLEPGREDAASRMYRAEFALTA